MSIDCVLWFIHFEFSQRGRRLYTSLDLVAICAEIVFLFYIDRPTLLKTWELMFLCASAMPPSKELAAHHSEYMHEVANTPGDSEVQAIALNTWNALKRSVKGGPRRTTPAQEEIEALLEGRKLTTIAYFLDDTFEEITYDMTTTISDAVEVIISQPFAHG